MRLFYRCNNSRDATPIGAELCDIWNDVKHTRRPRGQGSLALERWQRSGLEKTEAEDLLDWLEAHGCPHLEVSQSTDKTFAVSWWN